MNIISDSKLLYILYGPPGAGKGTISKYFEKNGYNVVGSGDELRKYILNAPVDDPLRKSIENELNNGRLVKTADLFQVVKSKLDKLKGEKILGDGLVRNQDQAVWLINYAKVSNIHVKFINLFTTFEVVEKRLKNRHFVPGNSTPFANYNIALENCKSGQTPVKRGDDCIEIIKTRFKEYESNLPLILSLIDIAPEYITLKTVDADNTPDEVFKASIS